MTEETPAHRRRKKAAGADKRFHVRLMEEGGEEHALGLLLTERPQIGFSRQLVNPYAAKVSQGDQSDSDLTEWSLVGFTDWRGGRGQEKLEDATAWYDSEGLETRIDGQITLGPLAQLIETTLPCYNPGSVTWYGAGFPATVHKVLGDVSPVHNINVRFGLAQQMGGIGWQLAAGSVYLSTIALYLGKTGTCSADLRVSIYSQSGTRPGTELTYVNLTNADISTTATWVTATLSTPYEIVAGTTYWLVLTSAEASQAYTTVVTPMGISSTVYESDLYAGGTWQVYGYSHRIARRLGFLNTTRAQSFLTGTPGFDCARVGLYLSKVGNGSPGTFTVMLCSDSAGSPDTASPLKTLTLDGSTVTQAGAWYRIEWASAQTLSAATTYWIVLQAPAAEVGDYAVLVWGGDAGAGYTSGLAKYKVGSGSWTAAGADHYFRINRPALDGAVVKFARYSGKWYCAAGDTVYYWDETSGWLTSEARAAEDITDMAVWDGKLYVARGAAGHLREYSGSAWSETTGALHVQLLYAGGPAGGWLHYTLASAQQTMYYFDGLGATLGPYECGSSDYPITGMAWFNDMLCVATTVALFGFVAIYFYQLLDWRSQEDANNGKGMMVWGKTGAMYIPLRFGLYRWNGDTMIAVGPEQGTGLPYGRAGRISALCGTGNWLYTAVDAGDGGTSSVFAYDGMRGWHQVWRGEEVGQRAYALGFETISSPSKLWVGQGISARYMKMPDYSDNPYQYTGYIYNGRGIWDSSWIGGDLLDVTKDLHEVVIRAEGVASAQPVDVWYEVDRSGAWTFLGRGTAGTRIVLPFEPADFTRKTTTTGCTVSTIELASGSTTTDMKVGDWVRIGSEVRQIASITDSDTFVLETALETIPDTGEYVDPTRAAGHEFRLRVALNTTSNTSTPKITAIGLRYQASVLDRWIYTLQVKVEDNMTDLSGASYPMSAATLRAELDDWCRRVAPIVLEDPDGRRVRVKMTAAGEGGLARKQHESGATSYDGVYSLNLIEV